MLQALFLAGAVNQLARVNASELLSQQASQKSSDVRRETEAIKFDVEKLFMITEALWSIVKLQNGYSDEDLARMIQEIDLRGGRLDGKVNGTKSQTAPNAGESSLEAFRFASIAAKKACLTPLQSINRTLNPHCSLPLSFESEGVATPRSLGARPRRSRSWIIARV